MLEMRLLKENVSKRQSNLRTETWVVHEPADPGNSVLQVDLFWASNKWNAWTGCFGQKGVGIALQVAETRNALDGRFPLKVG